MHPTAFSMLRPLPLALALALAFPAARAAVSVAADGSFTMGSDYLTTAKSGAFAQADTASAFSATTAPAGNKTWAFDSSTHVNAASDGTGHFGASIVTDRTYGAFAPIAASSHTELTSSLTNTSGAAQAASFALDISSVYFSVQTGVLSGTNSASFSARVYVGSAALPIWSTGFTVDNLASGGGMAGTTTGTDIGVGASFAGGCSYGCTNFNSYSFGGSGSAVIDLGTVAAGDTLEVRYVVDLATESTTYGGAASVWFNDPAGVSSGAASTRPAAGVLAFQATTPVPEPESAALLAAGLGLVAAAARRRRRSA